MSEAFLTMKVNGNRLETIFWDAFMVLFGPAKHLILFFCSTEWTSHRLGTTWRWLNDQILIFNSQLFSAKTYNGLITHMDLFSPVCMCKTLCINPNSSGVNGLNACHVFRRAEEVIQRVCPKVRRLVYICICEDSRKAACADKWRQAEINADGDL